MKLIAKYFLVLFILDISMVSCSFDKRVYSNGYTTEWKQFRNKNNSKNIFPKKNITTLIKGKNNILNRTTTDPGLTFKYIKDKLGFYRLNDSIVEPNKMSKISCLYDNIEPKNDEDIQLENKQGFRIISNKPDLILDEPKVNPFITIGFILSLIWVSVFFCIPFLFIESILDFTLLWSLSSVISSLISIIFCGYGLREIDLFPSLWKGRRLGDAGLTLGKIQFVFTFPILLFLLLLLLL